jgi:hypothetical protein
MAATPDLRIGDADREAGATALREHYAQGRLSLAEFNERLDAIFAATTQRQLDGVTHDLPHIRPAATPPAVTGAARQSGNGWAGTQWPGTQWQGAQWQGTRGQGTQGQGSSGQSSQGPGARRGAGARLAMSVLTLVVVFVAAFFLLRVPSLLHFRHFPVPGRFGILIAGLMILRAIFRRIFGGRRHWTAGHYQSHGHGHHGGWHGLGPSRRW